MLGLFTSGYAQQPITLLVCESMMSAKNYMTISADHFFEPEPVKKVVHLKDVPTAKRYDRFDHWPGFC